MNLAAEWCRRLLVLQGGGSTAVHESSPVNTLLAYHAGAGPNMDQYGVSAVSTLPHLAELAGDLSLASACYMSAAHMAIRQGRFARAVRRYQARFQVY